MKLTNLELRAARATMCAIFPDGGDPRITVHIGSLDLETFARYATEEVPFKPALGFRAVIWMAMLAPIFVLGRFATILGVTDEERDEVVSALIASSIYEVRALFVFFKAFTALYYFTSPKLRAEVTRPELAGESGKRLIASQSLVREREGDHKEREVAHG